MHHLIIFYFLQIALVGQLEHMVYPNQYPGVPGQKVFRGVKDGGPKAPSEYKRTTQGHPNFTLMERWIAMGSKDPSVLNTVWQVIGTDLHGRKVGCNLFSWKFLPHNMCPPFMLIANLTRNKAYKLSTSCFAPFFLNSEAVIRWSLVVSGIQYPLVIFWSLTGKYCIYKKYPGCPKGLTSGELFWDDQDGYRINEDGGVLPEGRYNHDTTINFCCRTDGDRDDPVLLPVKSPFFLLAYESAKCQMVKWAVSTVEWIHYDTEDSDNQDEALGAYPYNAGKIHPTIFYCYYRGEGQSPRSWKMISKYWNNQWTRLKVSSCVIDLHTFDCTGNCRIPYSSLTNIRRSSLRSVMFR